MSDSQSLLLAVNVDVLHNLFFFSGEPGWLENEKKMFDVYVEFRLAEKSSATESFYMCIISIMVLSLILLR